MNPFGNQGLRIHTRFLLLGASMSWIWKLGAASHISQLFCSLKSGCETLFTLCWPAARGGLVLADGRGVDARRFLLHPDQAPTATLLGPGSAAFSSHRCWRYSDCWHKCCEELHDAGLWAKGCVEERVLTAWSVRTNRHGAWRWWSCAPEDKQEESWSFDQKEPKC